MPWPAYAITTDKHLHPSQVERLTRDFEEAMRTGKTVMLTPGVRIEPFPQNPHAIADGLSTVFAMQLAAAGTVAVHEPNPLATVRADIFAEVDQRIAAAVRMTEAMLKAERENAWRRT